MSSDPLIRADRYVPTCRGQPSAGRVPSASAAVPAQPAEFRFPAAAVRAVASVPSRFKGGQVRQACHQFTAAAMEGLPVHGALRTSLPDWVSCLAGRSHVEHRIPAWVTGNSLRRAQHRLVLPSSNQRQGTPTHATCGDTQPCALFRTNTPPQSHTRFAVLADRQPFSFSRRALCVKEQTVRLEPVRAGTEQAASCVLQRASCRGGCAQSGFGHSGSFRPVAVHNFRPVRQHGNPTAGGGGVVTLCRFAEPASLPPGCRHSGTSSPRVLSFAHHNGRRS